MPLLLVIYGTSSLTLKNSTVSGNIADTGGGISSRNLTGPVHVQNSTLSGNTAFNGGAFYVYESNGHPIVFQDSTVAKNSASFIAAGIDIYQGVPPNGSPDGTLQNTIVSGNSAPHDPDLYGTFPSAFSLVQTPSSDGTITNAVPGSNIIGADPQLGALANNGGPTQTMALAPTSPAVDKGAAFGLSADQRGVRARLISPRSPTRAPREPMAPTSAPSSYSPPMRSRWAR